jgi:hypothetical protein
MTQIHDFGLDVRRHSDGSIDLTIIARAAALRGALCDASTLRSTFKLIMSWRWRSPASSWSRMHPLPSLKPPAANVREVWSVDGRRPQPTSRRSAHITGRVTS